MAQFKKKVASKITFKRGLFEKNREKVAGWVLDESIWLEVRESGCNEDGSEFFTITVNNITKRQLEYVASLKKYFIK